MSEQDEDEEVSKHVHYQHLLSDAWIEWLRNKAKLANKVRRVDRRTNALPTDQPANRPTNERSQL